MRITCPYLGPHQHLQAFRTLDACCTLRTCMPCNTTQIHALKTVFLNKPRVIEWLQCEALLFAPAAENLQLTAELARAQAYIDRDERSALLGDVDGLRREVLRLQGTVERLSSAPQVAAFTTVKCRNSNKGPGFCLFCPKVTKCMAGWLPLTAPRLQARLY